jgi:predicted ATPase
LADNEHRTIVLIDEVEYGLEPHRLVYLLNRLRKSEEVSQIFVTTHSPVAVEQLEASDLAVVRCTGGVVNAYMLRESRDDIQPMSRILIPLLRSFRQTVPWSTPRCAPIWASDLPVT